MAGAGYKLFNTGDVLTAAQVNTYLMEQTVMVFADAAARTTALTGVVSEGMISYLKDTNAVEVYNGSAWVSSDDPNAIQNTIVDAKGDLISATAADTPARLASSGNNGDVLTVDTSTSTGLKWAAPAAGGDTFAAGKNKIINGDFRINQRGFTSLTADAYGFDRWIFITNTGTTTYSTQTFTPGTAPVAGYEGVNFARMLTSGQTGTGAYSVLQQRIESVRTFANQTVTVSFWAKAASGTPKIAIEFGQIFGSGGSAAVYTYISNVTLSTSWARYSVTGTVPSISGKTVGTSDYLALRMWVSAGTDFNSNTGSIGVQNNTFDIWGVQAEAGSTATNFQTATGTLAGELAACQRYYWRHTTNASANTTVTIGTAYSTSAIYAPIRFPVTMRVSPSSMETSNLQSNDGVSAANINTISFVNGNPDGALLNATALSAAVTQYRPYLILATTNGYVAFNAEL